MCGAATIKVRAKNNKSLELCEGLPHGEDNAHIPRAANARRVQVGPKQVRLNMFEIVAAILRLARLSMSFRLLLIKYKDQPVFRLHTPKPHKSQADTGCARGSSLNIGCKATHQCRSNTQLIEVLRAGPRRLFICHMMAQTGVDGTAGLYDMQGRADLDDFAGQVATLGRKAPAVYPHQRGRVCDGERIPCFRVGAHGCNCICPCQPPRRPEQN